MAPIESSATDENEVLYRITAKGNLIKVKTPYCNPLDARVLIAGPSGKSKRDDLPGREPNIVLNLIKGGHIYSDDGELLANLSSKDKYSCDVSCITHSGV